MPSVEVNGRDLFYLRRGRGEPLLLIQGMSGTHVTWGEPFLSALEGSFDCIAFDHRGMGLSGRSEGPFTIADLAGDAFGVLDALHVESAHVVGISMGGMVAQEMAIARPERIRTLVLGATAPGGPGTRMMDPADLERLTGAMAARDRDAVLRAMWEFNLSPGFRAGEGRYEEFIQMATAQRAPGAVIGQQMQAIAAHDAAERLGQVTAPTLIVHGDEDRLLPVENARLIASILPAARLEIFEGVGHLFWWEEPLRSAELVREHALSPV